MRRHSRLLALLGALWVCAGLGLAQAQEDEVVPPEQAFPYSIEATPDRLLVKFTVLEGYYLYRERFGFAVDSRAVTLGAPVFPRGELHEDEFFGEQEIYRGDFEIGLPYRRTTAVDEITFELKLQGCADVGLCYLPQTWTRVVSLPAEAATEPRGSVFLTSNDDEGLLPVEEAFMPNARFDDANELTVSWQIAEGYYLYRDKLEITAEGGIELGSARFPDGVAHRDDNFGDVEVFYDYVEGVVPFSRASPEEIPVTIRAVFQGCKEASVCYPPSEYTMAMTLPASSEFAAGGADVMVSEQDQWAARILGDSWLTFLASFYGAGLLLAFTPCVLPMVPILSSIIAGSGDTSSRRGFFLSLAYVLGMAVTYTAAGALAALAGGQIQAMFQKPWIITLFAGLFVVLALGMFGVYELQMPTAVQSRLASLANRQKGGTFVGTAIVGALSALIVTTCVAPPLIGALGVIAQSGDVARGSAALFMLSIGMGSPLLLVGASAGQLLPKVGPWMNTVKAGFGVMMMGIAIWMMERVLPGSVTLVLWAVLVFLTGVFLGAFESLPPAPSASKRLAKGLGVLACLYGALMLVGALLGGEDPLQPLPQGRLLAGAPADESSLEFTPVESVAELDALLARARSQAQPVMVDFTAEWCVSCKEMEEYTFPDTSVIAALGPFMLLRADVTANDSGDQALLQRFKSFGPPTIAFFDASGREQPSFKLVGYVPADEFETHVERVAAL